VLRANGKGMHVRPVIPKDDHCHVPVMKQIEPAMMQTLMLGKTAAAEPPPDDDTGAAYSIALGQPPPQQPPEPGFTAVGSVMLPSAFDIGEQVSGGTP
jgi:hypothetical protein